MAKQRRSLDRTSRIPFPQKKQPKIMEQSDDINTSSHGISFARTVAMIACILGAAAICFKGYLETRVNTRFDNNKMVQKSGLLVPDQYWGSYRPGVYFGMKTRDPGSLLFGLMWFFPRLVGQGGSGLRHWCEQNDNLNSYIWIEHDGKNFGVQEIVDGPYKIITTFLKTPGGEHGGDWTAEITVSSDDEKLSNDEVALIFYGAMDTNTNGFIRPNNQISEIPEILGKTQGLGEFSLKLVTKGTVISNSYLSTKAPGLNALTNTIMESMRVTQDKTTKKRLFVLPGELLQGPDGTKQDPNFIAIQVNGKLPLKLNAVYESSSFTNRTKVLIDNNYDEELQRHKINFFNRFENTFHLKDMNWNDDDIVVAKSALSNMLGSIGYFYGASQVSSAQLESSVPYWKAPLFTAVPSRSFFPRGFLWDDAFHGLLISTWDVYVELDIIHHWFDLMNIEGWIPREQILGIESLSKVPKEFVVQINTNANPPVFFITLRYIVQKYGNKLRSEGRLEEIDRLFPRLQAWFEWFNTTQVGDLPGTYRWRGRDPEVNQELNPKTLTSGLDDYPRASHPNIDERHVDLRCWMAVAAATMAEIAQLIGRDGAKYSETYEYLTDLNLLNSLHWSEDKQQYADFGLHTDDVVLKRTTSNQHRRSGQPIQNNKLIRVSLKQPTLRLIDTSFGYVNLFPFLLQLLPTDAPQLGITLSKLEKTELLWTSYGLRSLSTTSPFYEKYNTEHDPPYWRGSIWINMNYLALKALKYYGDTPGPQTNLAKEIYAKLRSNIIKNVIGEYRRTGYFWEHYNDKTGHGEGCRPFTGWTALFVMIMSEKY